MINALTVNVTTVTVYIVLYGHLSSSFLSLSHSYSAGYLQTAHSTLLHARDYSLSEFCIEHAEWKCNQVACGWGYCIMIQPHAHTTLVVVVLVVVVALTRVFYSTQADSHQALMTLQKAVKYVHI